MECDVSAVVGVTMRKGGRCTQSPVQDSVTGLAFDGDPCTKSVISPRKLCRTRSNADHVPIVAIPR